MGPCHEECVNEDADEKEQEAYLALIDAAYEGDIEDVLKMSGYAPGFVFLNEERQSLQVLSCDRSILVGHVPISDADMDRIRASTVGLPSVPEP